MQTFSLFYDKIYHENREENDTNLELTTIACESLGELENAVLPNFHSHFYNSAETRNMFSNS